LTFTLSALLLVAPAAWGKVKEHYGDGFVVDLNHPASQVVDFVHAVTEDGIIRGTSDSRGASELYGASSAKTSDAFPRWTQGGTVLFKVRPGALAPDHFYQSNDQGTVVVRYVVQPLSADSCRLRIDAIFEEDSHHHHHPSDGLVENNEFEAIAAKIKEFENLEQQRREAEAQQQMQDKVQDLDAQLQQENTRLDDLNKKQADLRQKIQATQGGKPGRITTSAELKTGPYQAASVVEQLSQGDAVTVLQETPYWYRVQSASGKRGWVYRLMLEVAQ